jgi:hypothetical protein
MFDLSGFGVIHHNELAWKLQLVDEFIYCNTILSRVVQPTKFCAYAGAGMDSLAALIPAAQMSPMREYPATLLCDN